MTNIGEKVVRLRKAKGMLQKDLARRAQMCPAQLCNIESGRVSPTFVMVERLASALDTDIPGLIADDGQREARGVAKPVVKDDFAGQEIVPVRAVEPNARKVLAMIGDEEKAREELAVSRGVRLSCALALNRAHSRYEGAGATLAEELRADLGLGSAPLGDLATVLEFRGFSIHEVRLPKADESVLFWNERHSLPVVVLNALNTRERNLYRLAYELGTVCLYVSRGCLPVEETLEEHRFLTDFTAAFLMPSATVREAVAMTGLGMDDWTMSALVALKACFNVSAETFALRLEELGLMRPSLRIRYRDELRAYYKSHPKAMEPQPKGASASSARWSTMKIGGKGV